MVIHGFLWYSISAFLCTLSIDILHIAIVAAYLVIIPYNIVYYRVIETASYSSCGYFYGRAFSVLFLSHSFNSLYPPIWTSFIHIWGTVFALGSSSISYSLWACSFIFFTVYCQLSLSNSYIAMLQYPHPSCVYITMFMLSLFWWFHMTACGAFIIFLFCPTVYANHFISYLPTIFVASLTISYREAVFLRVR